MSSCLCSVIISEDHNSTQCVYSGVLKCHQCLQEKVFCFTAHRSPGLIFKPIKGVCSIIKHTDNDVHVTGCDSVLKVLADGQIQIAVATFASARDRQECWGRSRESWYVLYITLAKNNKQKKNYGLALLLHCKKWVDCHSLNSEQFPCSKRTPKYN